MSRTDGAGLSEVHEERQPTRDGVSVDEWMHCAREGVDGRARAPLSLQPCWQSGVRSGEICKLGAASCRRHVLRMKSYLRMVGGGAHAVSTLAG